MQVSARNIAKGSGLLLVGQYGAVALGFAATVIAARLLGPKDFGLVALIIAYPELIQSALAVKSSSVTTRYLVLMRAGQQADDLAAISKLGYGVDVTAGLLAFGLVAATASVAVDYFAGSVDPTGLASLTLLYAASLPVVALDHTNLAVLTATQRFASMAGLQLAESALRLGLVVVLANLGFGVGGVVAATGLSATIAAVSRSVAAARALKREGVTNWLHVPVTRVSWLRREFATLVSWNYVLVTLGGVMIQVPLLWLGRMRGPEEAGFYRLATSVVTSLQYPESALGRVVSPVLVVAVARESAQKLRSLVSKWTATLGLPLAAAIALGLVPLPWLMQLVFGHRFAVAMPSVQIMAGSAVLSGLVFWVGPFYYAAGRIDLMTKLYSLSAMVGLAAAWWAIAHFGLAGMAVVFCGTRILFTLALLGMAITVVEHRHASDGDDAGKRVRPASRDPAGVSADSGWRRA